jgi:glucokinase
MPSQAAGHWRQGCRTNIEVEMIGIAVGSAINLVDPELAVIGGGMAEKLRQDVADRIAARGGPVDAA